MTMDDRSSPKGPYREVLDWLAAQLERLDALAVDLAAQAAAGSLSEQEVQSRRELMADARRWLAEQLADALAARGLTVAA
jgi:hypothetical protein